MVSNVHIVASRESAARLEYVLSDARGARAAAIERRDPGALGWARYYEVKSLYELRHFAEAYEAYRRTEPVAYVQDAVNAAWLATIAMELAMRVGASADEIIGHGDSALAHRRMTDDDGGCIAARQTLCAVLAETYPERVAPFAVELFAMAKDDTTRLRAVRWLLKAHDTRPRPESRAHLERVREALDCSGIANRDAMIALLETRLRAASVAPPAAPAPVGAVAAIRAKRREVLAKPTTTFDAQCLLGEIGDAFLAAGAYDEAEKTYRELLWRVEATHTYDTFIMAKLALGMLLALVGQNREQEAIAIWTQEPGDRPYGLGISTLEQGGTSVDDLEIYFLVSAHLHSLNPDRARALEAVSDFMRRVSKYALEERREWLPIVIADWKHFLRQVYEAPPPSVDLVAISALERQFGRTIREGSVRFPVPSPWAITWGDGTVTEVRPDGSVRRLQRN